MFCSQCGKEIKEGAKFCTSCGTPTVQTSGVGKINAVPEVKYDTVNMKKKKGFKGWIGLFICFVIVAGVCAGIFFYIGIENLPFQTEKKQSEEKDIDEEKNTDEEKDTTIANEDSEEQAVLPQEEAKQEEMDYMAQAQEAYAAEDYELAIQCCEMAIQENDQNVEAYSTKALAFLKQEDCEAAASTLCDGIVATDSEELRAAREQLIADVTIVSCLQFNSLDVLICEVNYDVYGNAVKYTYYSDGTTVSSIEEYSYDDFGRCTKMVQCNSSGTMQWQEDYDYDGTGNMIYVTHYNSKMREEWSDYYSYDMQGRKTALERYNPDGTLSWWDEYTYMDDENMTKTAHPSDGSTVIIHCKLSFDELGNQTGYEEYDSSGTSTYAWTKEYNGLGDEVVYLYGDSTVNYVYEYTYNR